MTRRMPAYTKDDEVLYAVWQERDRVALEKQARKAIKAVVRREPQLSLGLVVEKIARTLRKYDGR